MNKHHFSNHQGFTLIELLVVMAIISLLLMLAAPRYFRSLDVSKESILAENLHRTRDTIDKFYGDHGRYPESLVELVDKQYLRSLPFDPITDSTETWIIVPPKNNANGTIFDIKSGASGQTADGKPFQDL